MSDETKILDIISKNRDNIAFIIGNGIHYQYKDGGISWEKLLQSLWRKYVQDEKITIPDGISNTEFYDIIEMERSLRHLENKPNKEVLMTPIKKIVAKKFDKKKKVYKLAKCIKVIKSLNAPILTTNFDTYISYAITGAKKRIFSSQKGGMYKFTYHYPWNVYYSDKELENPLRGFAVWHIHGIHIYSKSIRLGLSDYMGCVVQARKLIQGDKLEEYFSGKNQQNWIGYNTWLHILFNKYLFIFGLGLNENEVFLRWLMIQRAKYSRMFKKSLSGCYVAAGIDNGKRFFLERLGFNVVDIKEYSSLYKAFETYNEI